MRRLLASFVTPVWRGSFPLWVVTCLLLASNSAWAQPVNDDFADPTPLAGESGTHSQDNIGASLELPNEPTATNIMAATTWFAWTAPSSGTFVFDTAGSAFDTVLIIYTGNSYGTLQQVAFDDDSGAGLESRATFVATEGVTYRIQLGGYSGVQGNFTLNWMLLGSQTTGLLRLTSTSYLFSQRESFFPLDDRLPQGMRFLPARATVTRANGAVGRIYVDYTVSNIDYNHTNITTVFGTNVLTTFVNSNGIPFTTNVFMTNYVNEFRRMNNPAGTAPPGPFPTCSEFTAIQTLITNITGSGASGVTNIIPVPDIFCANSSRTVIIVDTNVNSTTTITTNLFCFFLTNVITRPSAVPGVDYLPSSGTLVFDDFEMSEDIYVFLGLGTETNFLVNPTVVVTLSNPRLDEAESSTLQQPILDPGRTTAYMAIQHTFSDPINCGRFPTTNSIVNFERATLRVLEFDNANRSAARVAVQRTGTNFSAACSVQYHISHVRHNHADPRNNIFRLQAGSDYATPSAMTAAYSTNADFTSVSGTLTFPADPDPEDLIQYITIPINNDQLVEFNEDMLIQLYDPSGCSVGAVSTCTLTIISEERLLYHEDSNSWTAQDQPAGAADLTYNPNNDPYTQPVNMSHPGTGTNGTVFAIAMQPDGKAILGGDFTSYNGTNRVRLVRVNTNGMVDSTFYPGAFGPNLFVTSLALEPATGKVLVGGGFTSINGTQRKGIARLNSNGSLDGTFNPGSGADATVWSVLPQPDGKVLIGGDFTTFNSTNRMFMARLNSNGSLDTTFDTLGGPNGSVLAMALQPDGKIIIGGQFTMIHTTPRNGIARLNADGTVDESFDPGVGADDVVYSVLVQPDGKILVGGAFNQVGLLGGKGIARLNSDGSVDTDFRCGSGADDVVYAMMLQPDGRILVAGTFQSINETRRVSIARLLPEGGVDTSFMDTAYNQFAGLPNLFASFDINPPNPIFALGLQADGAVIIGGNFSRVGGGFTRTSMLPRSNVARLIGNSTPGPGTLQLRESYSTDTSAGQFFVSVLRTNGTLGPVGATVLAVDGSGTAVAGVDYDFAPEELLWGVSWSRPTWMLSDGLFGPNEIEEEISGGLLYPGINPALMTIYDNSNPDSSVDLRLTAPRGFLYLGGRSSAADDDDGSQGDGEVIPLGVALGNSLGTLNIIHNNTTPGTLSFSSASYTATEGGGFVSVTVVRTGGSDGAVSARVSTAAGPINPAVVGTDYDGVTNRLVSFGPGVTSVTFSNIFVKDPPSVAADRTVLLKLFTPTGGATLGLTNSILTIVDNDFANGHVSFSAGSYSTNENSGPAVIAVNRLGGSAGTLSVTFRTMTNGSTAVHNVNYLGVTNTLSWTNGDVSTKFIPISLINDGVVTSTLSVRMALTNALVNGVPNTLALGGIFTNTTLFITNSDALGTVQFTSLSYSVNEHGGFAIIPVVRVGGSAQTIQVSFSAQNGTAFDGSDFTATNGTMLFTNGEVSKVFHVPIIDNPTPDSPRFITLILSNAIPVNGLGFPSTATLNITDNELYNQPPGGSDTEFFSSGFNSSVFALGLQGDGKLVAGGDFTTANGIPRNRIARLNANGTLDTTFSTFLPGDGADASIRTITVQTNGRILIGGFFTNVNGTTLPRIARLNFNGSIDSSFDPGSGANNPIYDSAETWVGTSRRILVAGAFTSINGVNRNSIAQLLDDGFPDSTFDPGTGANGTIYAMVVQPDGKIIIGGDFTTFNGAAALRVARLNRNGSLDSSFNAGLGPNASVRAIALQLDGRVLIGGLFTDVNGTTRNHIARLNANGSLDGTFNPGLGASDNVQTISIQSDTRIILGGDFTECNGVSRNRITRLNPDGTTDPTINFGLGFNSFVAASLVQPDDKIVLAGGFTEYDGEPAERIARVYGGSVAGSGTFEFTSATYAVNEDATNTVVTVRRRGGTSGPNPDGSGDITVDFQTANGTAIAGINYSNVNETLVFPPGEVFQTVTIPVINDGLITPSLTVDLSVSNPSSPAGIGNQPTATLTIHNVDSSVHFVDPVPTVAKNTPDGVATIRLVREGSTNGSASVLVMTTTNGTAVEGLDYFGVTNLVTFDPGIATNQIQIPIIDNGLPQGNRTVHMVASNAIGATLVSPAEAMLTIIDTVPAPGELGFAATNYVVTEGTSNILITVVRTNGSFDTVSVGFSTVEGTAAPVTKYIHTNGVLTFADGEISKSFLVKIVDNGTSEGDQTLSLILTNAVGATIFAPTNVPLTIRDNDVAFQFANGGIYNANETNSSVTLNVHRLNGTNGTYQVDFATTNGTALAATNYVALSGSLIFNPGETNKTITVFLIHDTRVTSNLTFNVNLLNPSPGAQLMFPFSASVNLQDAEAGIGFTNTTFSVQKNGTNAVITVFSSNPDVGPITVNYSTSDGTAIAGQDYTAVNGTLVFSNGVTLQTFTVPIINNSLVQGDGQFNVSLSSPSAPGQLVSPSTASVTIVDINSGLRFSSPTYSVFKSGVLATIDVIRTGFLSNTVTVEYSTADGTATNGLHYLHASGTLTFTNGETAKSFTVSVIDSTVVQPDRTVLLQLSNPAGIGGVLVPPSAAVLTIRDDSGSLILPAGASLISESIPNGLLDTNETVTMWFALRNGGGTNTTGLTATLLATNGVFSPSGVQNYGALSVNGPSASRQFTFSTSGTNGQQILATFRLQENGADIGTATFTFALGTTSRSFTNNALIVINDNTNATPYPSIINVSGVGGSVSKLTVTFDDFKHLFPADVGALLVSPTGQKTVLMANAGANNSVQNIDLTFDDSAAGYMPATLVTGTNRPTAVGSAFPVFPFPAPAAPYTTNMSAFNAQNPNGAWSLYIIDDSLDDEGAISNGWRIDITAVSTVGSASDLVLGATGSPDPVVVSNTLTYAIAVTNFGPSTATGVLLTNTLPDGAVLLSSNASQGSITVNGSQLVWSVGTLLKDAAASLTLTVRPTVIGIATNSVIVRANESDPNTANNAIVLNNTVEGPTADLIIGVVGVPSPLWLGADLTYTLNITNLGPAVATGVMVTNTLPPSVILVSATPGYTLVGNVLTFTNLGSLGVGAQTSASIVVQPTVGGTITNISVAASVILDPLKANNTATVKTIVQVLQLNVLRSGANLVINWPIEAAEYDLEYTTNLNPPVIWLPVTNAPAISNGLNHVTIGTSGGPQFFRLRSGP